jgi:hypothetical protein
MDNIGMDGDFAEGQRVGDRWSVPYRRVGTFADGQAAYGLVRNIGHYLVEDIEEVEKRERS